MTKKVKRTTQGLRDALFDEIEQMRSGEGDPTRALAVANLARQIISTAKVEMDFHVLAQKDAPSPAPLALGSVQLGSAASADSSATEA